MSNSSAPSRRSDDECYNMNSRKPSFMTTESRSNNAQKVNSNPFLAPPEDPSGRKIDLSDRLLICASSNMRNEVVVGGSDHALYSIDVNDPRKLPVTMYGKKCGHTDWVTTVAHLADGNVLSGSMDGRLCMWSASNRRVCQDLQSESTHPISKVVTDARYNVAASCCYDNNISLWSFGNGGDAYDRIESKSSGAQRTATAPPTVLSGHAQPVLECGFKENVLVSGDKGGSIMMWDMTRSQALHRFRAHPGAVTAIDVMSDRNTIISCGTDGYVKIWDPRTAGSGLVHKIPAHIKAEQPPPQVKGRSTVAARPQPSRTIGGTVSGGGFAAESTTSRPNPTGRPAVKSSSSAPSSSASSAAPAGPVVTASAISCMATVCARGSSDVSYVITGSGGAGGSVVLLDARASFGVVSEWSHHRNGVYSLCVVDDECVFSGDGAGNLLCHSVIASQLDRPRDCVRYGIGSSEVGAVRAICCVGGKVAAAGEDGNVMVYDHSQPGNSSMVYK